MSISAAQFRAWLLADDKRRCVLAEVQAWSGGTVVTRYLSNLGFVSAPSDTPANQAYDEILAEVPSITSRMSEALRGYSQVSFGDLHVRNGGGALDAWLLDAWDGRPVRLYLGDPAWPKADFRQIFFGAMADIEATGNDRLTLKLRDRQYLLDVPMLPALVGGTGPAKDRRRPACFGRCRHVEPVLLDEATRTYAVHDGAIQAVDQVYSNGVPIAYTVNLAAGEFSLSGALTGQITADVRGCKAGGVYVDKTADIVQRIVLARTELADLDAASFAALNAAAPGEAGLYVSGDGIKVLGTLDALLGGVGGYYTVDRQGRLVLGQFAAATGTPVLALTDEDLRHGQARLMRRMLPKLSVRVGYARYFGRVGLPDASLAEGARQRFAEEYLVAKATNTVSGHLMAVDGDLEPSCYANQADATAEAARRAALWSQLRRVFQLPGFLAAQQLKLGDVIGLELSRYGLEGVLGVVVGLREAVTGGRVEVEVFV
jgi:hypothetical protein